MVLCSSQVSCFPGASLLRTPRNSGSGLDEWSFLSPLTDRRSFRQVPYVANAGDPDTGAGTGVSMYTINATTGALTSIGAIEAVTNVSSPWSVAHLGARRTPCVYVLVAVSWLLPDIEFISSPETTG